MAHYDTWSHCYDWDCHLVSKHSSFAPTVITATSCNAGQWKSNSNGWHYFCDRHCKFGALYVYRSNLAELGWNPFCYTISLGLGIGGVVGSLFIGTLIDRIGRPGWIMGGILILLALAMFSLPLSLGIPILMFLPFFIWGAMGWASLAPQQHVLLELQPKHGPAVVALNSSANYLGSSVGSALGGVVMVAGLTPSQLPFAAGCLVLVALLRQLVILSTKRKG